MANVMATIVSLDSRGRRWPSADGLCVWPDMMLISGKATRWDRTAIWRVWKTGSEVHDLYMLLAQARAVYACEKRPAHTIV